MLQQHCIGAVVLMIALLPCSWCRWRGDSSLVYNTNINFTDYSQWGNTGDFWKQSELSEDRVVSFAYSFDDPSSSLTEGSEVAGPTVDLMLAVCAYAGKICVKVKVPSSDCYDDTGIYEGAPKSNVLDNRIHDVCADIKPSSAHSVNYDFPSHPFNPAPSHILIRKKDAAVELSAFTNCNNSFKVASPGCTTMSRACLLAAGYYAAKSDMVKVDAIPDSVEATEAIIKAIKTNKADIGLVNEQFAGDDILNNNHPEVDNLGEIFCPDVFTGLNMMTRKKSTEFKWWWSRTLKTFICSGQSYTDFCDFERQKFGVDPRCFAYAPGSAACGDEFGSEVPPSGVPKPFDENQCDNEE